MNAARRFLLGLVALGLQAALTMAQEPVHSAASPVDVLTSAEASECSPCVMEICEECGCCAGGWIGGVGLYLMEPYFSNNLAFGLQTTVGGNPGTRTDIRVDISHDVEVSPLLWLGYLGEDGWGGRARYWYFRQGTSESVSAGSSGTVIFSAAPLGLSLTSGSDMAVTSKLEIQSADLEAIQSFEQGCWDFLFAAGIRLARVSQTYNAYINQAGQNTLVSGHNFHGVGPTLAVEARRPIGCSGIALFGSARGSVVLGSAKQNAALPDQNVAAADHRNRGLPIGELELGLEYGRDLGGSRLFGQMAFVGQDWFGAGGASRSSLNVAPGGAFNGAAYVGDSDISFLGVSFRMGLDY